MRQDALSTTFAALADPTRRAILERLAHDPASVGELAAPFEISLPAVSRHLKVLEGARLIRREKAAQWRRCRLQATPLREVTLWLVQYRRFWEERLDSLAAYLEDLQRDEEVHENGKPRGHDPRGRDDDEQPRRR